jgi:hypothetical protein
LPAPFARGAAVFPLQGPRQVTRSISPAQIFLRKSKALEARFWVETATLRSLRAYGRRRSPRLTRPLKMHKIET